MTRLVRWSHLVSFRRSRSPATTLHNRSNDAACSVCNLTCHNTACCMHTHPCGCPRNPVRVSKVHCASRIDDFISPAGPTCSKVRPAQQNANETHRFSGGQAGDMVVVTANCATSDHRPTLGGRCAIECIDGQDYGFFVMAEITSFPAGM